jgi:hypothetical protein
MPKILIAAYHCADKMDYSFKEFSVVVDFQLDPTTRLP